MFERKKPLVSIIIPSWFKPGQDGKYGKDETFWFAVECLDRLIMNTPRDMYELIIIDNGSTLPKGKTINLLSPNKPIVKTVTPSWQWKSADILIRNQENLGFGPACNQGFSVARGEYICCLNNDVLMFSGWLEAMLEAWKTELNPKLGVLMPALIHGVKDAREALLLDGAEINLQKNRDIYSPGAEFGSLFVLKKELAEAITNLNKKEFGLATFYNEDYKLGFSEDRQAWRQVRMLGYETYRTHNTRIFHQGNMSIGKIPDRKKYTEANREYLAKWKKKHNLV